MSEKDLHKEIEKLKTEISALKKRKKYGLVWEEKTEDVVEECKTKLPVLTEVAKRAIHKAPNDPTNIIIEGDNYHALSVLNYTHQGKIDVIYIDPPYNTGAKDWKYNNDYVDDNDTYRHSKWLSMMNHRLVLAKNLLTSRGILICTIDHNEQEKLGMLLLELFPDKKITCVTIVHNPAGIQGENFSYTHEYAYFVYPSDGRAIEYQLRDDGDEDIRNFRDVTGEESLRTAAANCFYPILVKNNKIIGFGDVCDDNFHPKSINIKRKDGIVEIYPVDPQGVERKWRFARQTVEAITKELSVKHIRARNVYDIVRTKNKFNFKTVWTDSKYSANNQGTQLLNRIIKPGSFSYPKSLYAVIDCVDAASYGKKDHIILDFFAGSGTTGHAVMKLNQEDGGKRQFILCTNNENKIAEEVTYPRIKKVIEGYADEKGIPANVRYFKTDFVKKDQVSDDTRRELVERSTEMICVRENTFENKFDNASYKIFTNGIVVTGILFNLKKMDEFKAKIDKLALPAHLYIFSVSNDAYEDDFDDLAVKHKIVPIPESILEVYRKLYKRL
jgi:adenine-specific DNA-methyltransferase